MNIRKNIDYTAMYIRINDAMQADLSQMERYFVIGQAVAERPEKGAAVAAAEYIQKNWPDGKGYSPRNLRRMRELYRVYGDCPDAITLAEKIGWTQNVVILEAELEPELRLWYMRAVSQLSWSKLELIEMIKNEAHMEIALDNEHKVGDNQVAGCETEIASPMKAVKYIPAKLFRLIWQRCRGKPKIGVARWPITICPTFMAKRTIFMRCYRCVYDELTVRNRIWLSISGLFKICREYLLRKKHERSRNASSQSPPPDGWAGISGSPISIAIL